MTSKSRWKIPSGRKSTSLHSSPLYPCTDGIRIVIPNKGVKATWRTLSCEVVADSINSHNGVRLTTFLLKMPRFVLAELNTHRMLSKSAESSRAMSVRMLCERVENDPYTPIFMGGGSSMAASRPLPQEMSVGLWRESTFRNVETAKALADLGVHKSFVNRLLEPFAHVNVVVSMTDSLHFLTLRLDQAAQPDLRAAIALLAACLKENVAVELAPGYWHAPFITGNDVKDYQYGSQVLKVSAARCARVSYGASKTAGADDDLALAEKLAQNGHWSPFEHPAQAVAYWDDEDWDKEEDRTPARIGNYSGWKQLRKDYADEFAPGEWDPNLCDLERIIPGYQLERRS